MVPDVDAACERFEKLGVEFVKRPNDGKQNITKLHVNWQKPIRIIKFVACIVLLSMNLKT